LSGGLGKVGSGGGGRPLGVFISPVVLPDPFKSRLVHLVQPCMLLRAILVWRFNSGVLSAPLDVGESGLPHGDVSLSSGKDEHISNKPVSKQHPLGMIPQCEVLL
jgi:hypothetical protein